MASLTTSAGMVLLTATRRMDATGLLQASAVSLIRSLTRSSRFFKSMPFLYDIVDWLIS
jgi:hypothetical protein